MVWRRYAVCSTCKTNFSLRISIGHNVLQEHSFHCTNCNQIMKIALHVNQEMPDAILEFSDNCEAGTEEGIIINLNPEFVFSEEELHQDCVFPWMRHAMEIHEAKKIDNPSNEQENNNADKLVKGNNDHNTVWLKIKKAWQLSIDDKNDLSTNFIDIEFNKNRTEKFDNINQLIFDFFIHFNGPHLFEKFDNAAKIMGRTVSLYSSNIDAFYDYYLNELHSTFMHNYIDIFSDYFSDFSEYSQTRIYVLTGMPFPDRCVSSSDGFNSVKMFYGNAYEIFTSHIQFLACLNNISSGRNFDEFEKMDLKQYLTINKANRANPLKKCEEYFSVTDCLDSKLRNATHHKSAKLSKSKKHIEYRSGGVGALHTISYGEYLYKCNHISTRLMILLLLELMFKQMVQRSN